MVNTIRADETAKISITDDSTGLKNMTIDGPCMVDTYYVDGKFKILGIRQEGESPPSETKFNIGDIIEWNENYFLIRYIKNFAYNTLNISTGLEFTLSTSYGDKYAKLRA